MDLRGYVPKMFINKAQPSIMKKNIPMLYKFMKTRRENLASYGLTELKK